MSTVKTANLNSVAELSQAVEEKLPESLSALGYTESFAIIDTKLAIGYASAVLAAGTYYLEKKYSFYEVHQYTVILVGLYFVLSLVNYIYTKYVAKKIIYSGKDKKGNSITISGEYDKYIPQYNLSFKYTQKGNATEFKDVLKFTTVFDTFGTLRQDLLDKWVKNTVETSISSKSK